MEPVVTLVTAGAGSADDLTEQDYRDIYAELRSKTTLRQFADFIGSKVSFAWWSKWERGEAHLDRERRVELRRAVGLAALPRAVTEVTAEVDPDARVWQVGSGRPDRVVMVGRETHEPVTLQLNGNLEIMTQDRGENAAVTAVTRARAKRSIGHICLSRPAWERLNAARLRAGLSWEEFLGELEAEHGNAA